MIRTTEFWGGLFWLGAGAFVLWAGRNLGLGRVSEPGSGFALFWLGAIMSGLALSIILQALRAPGASLATLWAGARWRKVLFVIVCLLAYGVLFEPVGFIVCTLALLMSLMLFVDPVDVRLALPISLVSTLGMWFAITKALKIQLPAGILSPWLA